MAKITRYNGNLKAFASESQGTERTIYGDVTQSNNLTDNINADYLRGLAAGLDAAGQPTEEDFNGALFTVSQLSAYLHQMGVAEWSGSQEYHVGSIVNRAGVLYVCKTNNLINATVPESDIVNWGFIPNTNITTFGFKNYIINGKKVINQRALKSTDNSYNQDRWYKAGNNWFQGIEGDGNLISGKKYTISWKGADTAGYYVGTATSATINSQTFTAITNGGSFTLTISAGQNLWIKFASDATGSTFNFVQLEEGSIATPFEQRPIGLELSLCQRYYEITQVNVGYYGIAGLFWFQSVPFSVKKRVTPTVEVTTPTGQTNIGTISTSGNSIYTAIPNGTVVATGSFSLNTLLHASAEL